VKQRVGHLAGGHVGLIAIGDGEDHVRVLATRLAQDFREGAVSDYGAQIQPVLQLLQTAGVGIDDGDVIAFGYKILGNRCAAWPPPRMIIFIFVGA
jgi:hypothetical protein